MLDYLAGEGRGASIIAGGTDIIPAMRRGALRPRKLVDITGLRELRYVRHDNGLVRIGALTTISQLVSSVAWLGRRYYCFGAMDIHFGSWSIRNMATVGGNISSGGERDLVQVFRVLEGYARIRSREGERIAPAWKPELREDEIITEVFFKDLNKNSWTWFDKLEKRAANGIGIVTVSLMLRLDDDGVVDDVRIALNRVRGKEAGRARETEQFLKGKRIGYETLREAMEVMGREISPASDFRASGEFRREASKILTRRAIEDAAKMITAGGEAE